MASAIPRRLLSRGVDTGRCLHICITPLNIRRAASSKHPKGFVPPAKEDLDELRERVQEFTSMLFPDECDKPQLNSACRARDPRRGRSKDRFRQCISYGNVEEAWGCRLPRYNSRRGLWGSSNGLSGALYRNGGDKSGVRSVTLKSVLQYRV